MKEKHEGDIPAVSRDEKILGLLGLAARAGRLTAGAEKIADAARSGTFNERGSFIAIACDTSPRTKKNLLLAAGEGGIPYAFINADMKTLGLRTGGKGPASAVAVTDRHMAPTLAKLTEPDTNK